MLVLDVVLVFQIILLVPITVTNQKCLTPLLKSFHLSDLPSDQPYKTAYAEPLSLFAWCEKL